MIEIFFYIILPLALSLILYLKRRREQDYDRRVKRFTERVSQYTRKRDDQRGIF